MKKEVTRNHKEEMKSQKLYFTDCNLFIAQDLWQDRYQFLLIILLKELMISNVNTDTIIINVKLAELNITIESAFLITPALKIV